MTKSSIHIPKPSEPFPAPITLLHEGADPIGENADKTKKTDISYYSTLKGIETCLLSSAGGSPYANSLSPSRKTAIDDAVKVIIQDNEYPIVIIVDGAFGNCQAEEIKQLINSTKVQCLITAFRDQLKKINFTEELSKQNLNKSLNRSATNSTLYTNLKENAITLLQSVADIAQKDFSNNRFTLSVAIPFEDTKNNKVMISFGIGDDIIYLESAKSPLIKIPQCELVVEVTEEDHEKKRIVKNKPIGDKLFLPPDNNYKFERVYTYQIPFTISSFQSHKRDAQPLVLFAATDGVVKLINDTIEAFEKFRYLQRNAAVKLSDEDKDFLSKLSPQVDGVSDTVSNVNRGKLFNKMLDNIALDSKPCTLLNKMFDDAVHINELYRKYLSPIYIKKAVDRAIHLNSLSPEDQKKCQFNENHKEFIKKFIAENSSPKNIFSDNYAATLKAICSDINQINSLFIMTSKLTSHKNNKNNASDANDDEIPFDFEYSIGDDLVFTQVFLTKGISLQMRDACWEYAAKREQLREFVNDTDFWSTQATFLRKEPAQRFFKHTTKVRTEHLFEDKEFQAKYTKWCKYRELEAIKPKVTAPVKTNENEKKNEAGKDEAKATDKSQVNIVAKPPEPASFYLTDILGVRNTSDKGDEKSYTPRSG